MKTSIISTVLYLFLMTDTFGTTITINNSTLDETKIQFLECGNVEHPMVHNADDPFIKNMKKNQTSLEEAKTVEEYSTVANSYERIASMKPDEWLPLYYCAYSNLRISNLQSKPVDKDAYLDKAQSFLDKAMKLKKDNSEIWALQGFVLMMKVSVDPATRGQSLAGKVTSTFEKAVQLDPKNPRAQFLLGNWSFGTAQFFKASTEESCEMIKNSVKLFEEEQPGELDPSWGKDMATGMLSYCQ